MGTFIDPSDLAPFATIAEAKAEEMIADAEAQAILAAPCLVADDTNLTSHQAAAVKSILRGAILRWDEAGSGAFSQETVGAVSVSHDTRQQRRALFWPSELEQLQTICSAITGSTSRAFSLNTAPGRSVVHADVCSVNLGATYCSCGADLAGRPLWETEG